MHDKLTGGIGGSNNGTTNNDCTTYYETVPSNYLEDQIWLESDRMGFLLDTLDIEEARCAARDREERAPRARGQAALRPRHEIIAHACIRPRIPYSWDVIGSMDGPVAASEAT